MEFRDFARRHPSKNKSRVRLANRSIKNQLIVTAIVIGMLLVLGLVLGLAMKLTQSRGSEESSWRYEVSNQELDSHSSLGGWVEHEIGQDSARWFTIGT